MVQTSASTPKYGFIYKIVCLIINSLQCLSLVELFKYIARLFNPLPNDNEKKANYNRIGTDIFIMVKWILVILIWKLHIKNNLWTIIVWYLIIANLFSYFYYHVWEKSSMNMENFKIDRVRRRFVNLLLAVSYSTFSFAYLYRIPYCNRFSWVKNIPTDKNAMMYSFSNSLAANYNGVTANSDFGDTVSIFQLLITFFFLTIILSKSMPQTTSTI